MNQTHIAGAVAAAAAFLLGACSSSEDPSALARLRSEQTETVTVTAEAASSSIIYGPQRLADALPNVSWETPAGERPLSVDAFVGHVTSVEPGAAATSEGDHPMEQTQVVIDDCDDTAIMCSLLVHVIVDDPLGGSSQAGDEHVVEVVLRGPAYGRDVTGLRDGARMAEPEDPELWADAFREVDRAFWLLTDPTLHPNESGHFTHRRLALVTDDGTIVPQFGSAEANADWFGDLDTIAEIRQARAESRRTMGSGASADDASE